MWAVVAAASAALGVTHGLRGAYFENLTATGTPAMTVVDPEISTAQITATWLGDVPQAFSARWLGYLMVTEPGLYTIGTRSDDASTMAIDGRRLVANDGSQTRTAVIHLTRGAHAIALDYVQNTGDYEMGLLWHRDDRAAGAATIATAPVEAASDRSLTTIPAWLLSPRPEPVWKIRAARVVDLLRLAALLGALALLLRLAWSVREPGVRFVRRHAPAAVLLFFVVVTIAETWPLAAHPARLSRNDNSDTVLNEWTLAWVAHEAPRAPLHLFDANIFYPERRTLVYSETMLVQAAMAAPFLWSGASPVLAYNLVLLAGFALSGWAMALVVARWTGSWTAGLTSGVLFAFNAHTLTRMPHLQAQHVEFLPFALLALDELLRDPRPRHALALAGWFTLQALTSVYLLVFTATAMTAAALARPEAWLGRRFRRVAPIVGLAALAASVALLPFIYPYWRVYHDQGLTRSLEDAIGFAAVWQDYLSTPSTLHYTWWSHTLFTGTALFPGGIALILAAVALVRGTAFRDPRARMCLAFGIAGVVLSFGATVPGYALLYRFVPILHSIRAVSRFGYLGIVAVAILAGYGVVELQRLTPPRVWAPIAFLLPLVAAAELSASPLWLARYEGVPAIYKQLKDVPNVVVAELPFPGSAAAFHHARYMLDSTEHWQPMINGYSGFQPISFHRNADALAGFPDAGSIATLRAKGVTHVFVHVDEIGPGIVATLDATPGVHKLATEGPIVLYRLDPAAPSARPQ